MVTNFEEFPEYLKIFLKKMWGEEKDFEKYIHGNIPYLKDKSILEVYNGNNGEKMVVDYLNIIAGRGGAPLAIKYDDKLSQYIVLEHDKCIYPTLS